MMLPEAVVFQFAQGMQRGRSRSHYAAARAISNMPAETLD